MSGCIPYARLDLVIVGLRFNKALRILGHPEGRGFLGVACPMMTRQANKITLEGGQVSERSRLRKTATKPAEFGS